MTTHALARLGLITLVSFSATWVYMDASSRRIGKIHGRKSFWNLSAGEWAVATLFLWIVALPGYILKRGELEALARQYPRDTSFRVIKALLLVLPGFFMGLGLVAGLLSELEPGELVATTLMLLFFVVPALHVALTIHVARDAKARNMDGAAIWMLATLFLGLLGWIIYEGVSPKGGLVACPACSNRRMQASALCPHCGQGWPAAARPYA